MMVHFWRSFREAAGLEHDKYEVVAFGDSPAMATELAALVVDGRKRATAGLLRDYEVEGKPLPKPGDYGLVVDGNGRPHCVVRTTEVRVGPLGSVDAAFAYDEGEGDRSLGTWLAEHRAFFERQAATGGFAMDDRVETVFERFVVVWPPEPGGLSKERPSAHCCR